LADETVVIGAHYDHVGRGGPGSFVPGSNEIHNGADDNASGTVSLLELARRLGSRQEKLPRRVVFIAFTGEESGLIGSARYTKEPIFPLETTIAMLNMDMVGRLQDDKLTVFGSGTSPIWDEMLKRQAKDAHFEVSLKPEGMGPSDHQSFFMKQIPVLHFFTGTHNDYHRPSDDWEKINIPGTERIVELIEKLTIEVASLPERPKYVAVQGTAQIGERAGSRPYFGSVPDFGNEKPGYSLGGVVPGGPAEKGGLKGGDRIVLLGTNKIENLSDFDLALRKFSPGDTVEVTVMRGDDKVTLKVVLDKPR
jgi:Zn-dependent M28 family amino/carboxypeptidase